MFPSLECRLNPLHASNICASVGRKLHELWSKDTPDTRLSHYIFPCESAKSEGSPEARGRLKDMLELHFMIEISVMPIHISRHVSLGLCGAII
jgi:hypothetical protein